MKNLIIVVFLISGSSLIAQNFLEITEKKEQAEEPIFTIVEKMPEFPGGYSKMFAFIKEKMIYPQEEYTNGISGTSYVTFVVEIDGSLSNIETWKGITGGEALDAAALDVIRKMPPWIPGEQNERKIRVEYKLPIKFVIEKK